MQKQESLLFALLLLATEFNAYSMDLPEVPIKKSSKKKVAFKWINIAGHILLGEMPIQAFAECPTSFADLPNDVLRHTIITLLTSYGGAQSLNGATTIIRSLTTVNKRLYTLINDPLFCLQTIKHLSTRFDCSQQEACSEMRTKAAKSRLNLQMRLFEMCLINNPLQEEFEELYAYDTDLEFTYTMWHNNKSNIVTPLMISAITNNSLMINYLLTKSIFVNNSDKFGITALMWAAKNQSNDALRLLCYAPGIALDQQDIGGNTALMHSLMNKSKKTQTSDYKSTEILINAGANLAIENKMKVSPLKFIKQRYQEDATAIPKAVVNKIIEKKELRI